MASAAGVDCPGQTRLERYRAFHPQLMCNESARTLDLAFNSGAVLDPRLGTAPESDNRWHSEETMRDHPAVQFPRGSGPGEDVLTDFGVSRPAFVGRLREIMMNNPPVGLDDVDVARLLAACS